MVLVVLLTVSAVSAIDDANAIDVAESADVDEVQAVDEAPAVDDVQSIDEKVNDDSGDVLAATPDDEKLADTQPMNVQANNVSYDQNTSIVVTAPEGVTNFDNNISIYKDGVWFRNITFNATTGNAVLNITHGDIDAGTYFLKAIFNDGTNDYAGETFLKITKATPVVNVKDVEIVFGNITKIQVNVYDANGNGVADGDVIITIPWKEGYVSEHARIKNGQADVKFDIKDLIGIFSGNSSSTFNISSLIGGNRTFNASSLFGGNGTFNISGLFGGNGSFNISGFFNENGTFSGSFNTSSLFGGNGTFNISSLIGGNGTFNITSLLNGTNGTFDIGSLIGNLLGINATVKFAYAFPPGEYNITVNYLENRNYYGATNDTAKLKILPENDFEFKYDIYGPSQYAGDAFVNVTLTDGYGNVIPNANITIIFDGDDAVNVTLDAKGAGNATFHNVINGTHTVVFQYNGTNITVTYNVVVAIPTSIDAAALTTNAVNEAIDGKVGKYFEFVLQDDFANLLANKTVQVVIGDKVYQVVTDDKGVGKVQVNIAKAGTYTATLCFLGDDGNLASFATATIKVTKQKTTLKPAKTKYKFKAKAKTKKVKFTLKNAAGKVIKNKKITLKVKSKTFSAKTNKKGVVTIKVKYTKKGTVKATAKFAGDDTYKAVSKKIKLVFK